MSSSHASNEARVSNALAKANTSNGSKCIMWVVESSQSLEQYCEAAHCPRTCVRACVRACVRVCVCGVVRRVERLKVGGCCCCIPSENEE
jgi:hypothetical protein